ncbi:MAG: protein-glutamate O-methyltransferase CheR [Deltaproteobacteria bacterium]|nr:protein-glutamate O-methyltransferase CheR [Deltaproteobacteria bacterium]
MSISNVHNNCSLSIDSFQKLREMFNERFGILFNDGDRYLLESRLSARILDLSLDGFEEYADLLSNTSQSGELESAIEMLTNNETYFFREDYQLNAFSAEILPSLQRRNVRKRHLNIWSAGCSSGEEVYSIAIFIAESELFTNWNVRVFGSDISSRMLARARSGIFSKSAFRNTSDYLRMKYFRRVGTEWALKNSIKEKCNFAKINLLDAARAGMLGKFDAIFCRNVLMYFDRQSRTDTIELFHRHLNASGYLLLGHTESLFNQKTPFAPVELHNAMVYQKREEAFV